jgi:hypothetical protein
MAAGILTPGVDFWDRAFFPEAFLFADFFAGTFFPFLRASGSAMVIA